MCGEALALYVFSKAGGSYSEASEMQVADGGPHSQAGHGELTPSEKGTPD